MSLETVDKEYIGQVLLSKGFRTWFLYMFRMVEGTPFILEPLHDDLLQVFDDIYNQYTKRISLNLPPRSAKTSLCAYFVAFCLAKNPKCNFIYTSYSQLLLSDVSRRITDILEHPVYKAMYPVGFTAEEEQSQPISDFWLEYLRKETGKNTYTQKKIVTYAGGVVYFSAIGSQITGFGAAIRGAKGFTGAVILDDPNKPADVYSQRMRDNVLRYFEETLLSRLNNSDAAIINVQQRLHVEDLSGHLKAKYGFDELVKPLLVNDVCQLPKQYTPERISELKRNQYMFSAQYQQHPIILGGQVFHRDWWRFYAVLPEFEYCFMTADTAMKIKQANDYSVFCLWGVTRETNDLYLVDMIRGKWEAPDLERQFLNFWAKWQSGVNHTRVRTVYIEDKASGTGLIQSIKRKGNIPIRPIMPEKDKLQRAYDATPFIEGGRVYLPQNENFSISKQMIDECEAFTTDNSQIHDDITDNLTYAVDIAYRKQPMRINPDVLL